MLVETAAHSIMGYEILTTAITPPPVPAPKADETEIALYKTFYAVLTLLMTSISEQCLYIVRTNARSPFEIWTALREHFLPSTNRNVIRLRGNFYRTAFKSFSSMAMYVDSINMQASMINQLLEEIFAKLSSSSSSSSSTKLAPPLITDMEKLTVLLYGLGDDFETTREILENDPNITFEMACRRLKEKADSMAHMGPSPSLSTPAYVQRVDHANATSMSKQRKRSLCDHCGGRHLSNRCFQKYPHLRPNAFQNSPGYMLQSMNNPNARPNSHTTYSHSGPPITSRLPQNAYAHPMHAHPVSLLETSTHQGEHPRVDEAWCIETFKVDTHVLVASPETSKHSLLIDSGASSHIVGQDFHAFLINWRKSDKIRIAVADSRVCESEFIADLPFIVNTASGKKHVMLHDVIYMSGFPRGLISVAKLSHRGIKTSFSTSGCTIQAKNFTIYVDKDPIKDLYLLPIEPLKNSEITAPHEEASPNEVIQDESEGLSNPVADSQVIAASRQKLLNLHSTLGHCSLRTLKLAVANGHIKGIALSDLSRTIEDCDVCKTAKLRKHTTNEMATDHPATQPFEKMHGDYGGKYEPTWNGKYGFSMYIDEFSYWISGQTIETKDLVRDHFKKVVSDAKTLGFDIQAIHTDSAKEVYEHKGFIEWLTQNNIRRSASAPHAQYQNGFAEVTMQQIQNLIRCALFQSGLPHSYWGEAFDHAIFTWNRTPKAKIQGVTPYEIIMEKVPDIRFMHPFGCQAFAIHHSDDLPKFSARGQPCILLGYDTIRKAYKLLSLDDLSILIRAPRDVTFFDHVFPIRECKIQNTMRSMISNVNKDTTSKPRDDYADFYVPNPSFTISGGDNIPTQPPSTPPLRIISSQSSSNTPPLPIPSTPVHARLQTPFSMSIQATPTPLSPPSAPEDLLTPLSFTPTPSSSLDPSFEEVTPLEWQNTSPVDNAPHRLQRVWGSTPLFFRNIPHDLPRLRSQVVSQDRQVANLSEIVSITEENTHVLIDHHALISEAISIETITPKSYAQAISLPEKEKWIAAMDKEMQAIVQAKTYDLVPKSSIPIGTKIATPIWSFRVKFDGTFKARLCFPGHRQQYGIDYFETESPVAKFATFRIYMVLVTSLGEKVFHFDIPNAFLNGDIHESVFMSQPPGYVDKSYPDHVCALKKALYGLRQASLAWYIKLDDVLTSVGLHKHSADPCFYYLFKGAEWVMVLIYVDDNAIAGSNQLRNQVIEALTREFRAKDLGVASRYIGTSIEYHPDGVLLHQKKDITDYLQKIRYFNATPLKTPFNEYSYNEIESSPIIDKTAFRSAIGTLMWYALCTRPDILFVVTSLAQFQSKPTKLAMDCVHRIYRYLRGTLDLGIFIPFPKSNGNPKFVLIPYSDASYSIPILGSKSASGVLFLLNGVPVHWISRKQRLISLSSTEAEIIASSLCAQELLWIMQVIEPIAKIEMPIEMHIDNLSMKYVAESVLMSHRTKHLDIRYMFVRQLLKDHSVVLKWIPSEENIADIFTKYMLVVGVFKSLISKITCNRIH